MTPSYNAGEGTVVPRALTTIEEQRAAKTLLLILYLIAAACILGILGACCSEFYSAGVGFRAAFPQKSDGTILATDLMALRYPIVLCLLFGDVLLQAFPSRVGTVINHLLNSIGLGAIFVLLAGVGAFMFCATFLTLGGGAGQGLIGHLVGMTLGGAAASMLTLSFMAAHHLVAKLLSVLPVIAKGREERARIAAGEAAVRDVQEQRSRVEECRKLVADMTPDALRRKAANEAGTIVAPIMAEAHDLWASRKLRGDRALEEQDASDVPDVDPAALEERYLALRQYSADYFYALLSKHKEA